MTIEITTDRTRMDLATIHDFLSRDSYWAKGIPLPVLTRALDQSLCFAALDGDALCGFARVITDYATFAYVADVFVLPTHRGRGIAHQLMDTITAHPSLQQLRRWMLVTRDAHPLYAKHGFHLLDAPARHMERLNKNPYAQRRLRSSWLYKSGG
jgi:GNAT superfamily N-acetyltransferase